jgi:hypothetical protein
VWLPERFYDDHVGRGLPSGTELQRGSRGVLVQLDPESARDLRDDAALYVELGTAELGSDMLGLVSSARAMLRRLADAPGTGCEHPGPEPFGASEVSWVRGKPTGKLVAPCRSCGESIAWEVGEE